MFRICGRLPTAENNRFPTAESSFLYSFVFVFGPSHSRSQAERYLWNRVACSDTKKICVCLWFIFVYVSTQCCHACWHVYIIHIFHAHSAWLKTSRILRRKRSAVAHAWLRCLYIIQGSPNKGIATSPPQWYPPPLLTPPTPPKPSICMYLHVICTYTYTYTHIYSPFHPSNLASLRYLQHLRATTSSTDLLYLYISIITFFSNRL